jgi:putative effector of murein hydrolase
MTSILGMVLLLGMEHQAYVTLLPKSITTAIGMSVSEELGGNVPVTILVIVLTGITGNIFAEKFLRLIKVNEPIDKGISIGSASHVIGTAKAMEMGQTEGAMSSLSIVTSGILTVLMASLFALLA